MKKHLTVVSLFDGGSGGQLALNELGFKNYTYYASEIEPHAIKVTQHNFPDTIQLGNVTKVKYENGILYSENGEFNVGHIDLLIGGSPCFVAGTKVLTNNGYKNIEDIEVGDMVLTHENRYRRVLDTGGSFKDIYKLKAQGIMETETTGNHPYLIKKRIKKRNSSTRKYFCEYSQKEWVNVEDIKVGDYVGIPIIEDERNTFNLSKEDCWILGRYLADGHYRKDKRKGRVNSYQYQLILSIGNDKIDHVKSKIKNRNYSCFPHSKSVHRLVLSSMELVNLIIKLGLGKGATNKKLNVELLNLPKELLKELLDGYFSGDGCIVKDKMTYSSVSNELIMGLNLAIYKVYGVACEFHTFTPKEKGVIEGREVNQNTIYIGKFDLKHKDKNIRWFVDENILWMPVKSIEKTNYKKPVFNIEVEDDNSYTANNSIVHNCQNLSRNVIDNPNHNQGLEGKDSKLFYEMYRILKEVKPTYFMLENVESMKDKDKDIITECMGVDPIMINSELVSAQDRKRYYWTNIEVNGQPKDKGLYLKDIVLPPEQVESKYWYDKEFTYHGDDKRVCATLDIKGKDMLKRVYNLNYKAPTLTTVVGGHQQKKVFQNGRCRKITPLEYERLQNVPDKQIIIEVKLCEESAINFVNVVEKNPTVQKNVLNVEKELLKEFAKNARENIELNSQQIKSIVRKNADMQTQKPTNGCMKIKSKEKPTIANIAEKKTMSKNQELEEVFATQNVFINLIEGKIIHFGKEELHQKDKNYTRQKNGKNVLKLYGKEITELVKFVQKNSNTEKTNNSISTTLDHLSMKNIEQIVTICYLYAKSVTIGYTANKTKIKTLSLTVNEGYTSIVSDTARYTILGNGWTIGVICWILKGLLDEY